MAKPPGGEGLPPEPVLRELRVPMIRSAVLSVEGRPEPALVIDVGLNGVFVERSAELAIGSPAEVSFSLPGNARTIRALCRVAWWHPADRPLRKKDLPAGLGLEFVEIEQEDARRVRRHVEAHCRLAGKARRFHPRWPAQGED